MPFDEEQLEFADPQVTRIEIKYPSNSNNTVNKSKTSDTDGGGRKHRHWG